MFNVLNQHNDTPTGLKSPDVLLHDLLELRHIILHDAEPIANQWTSDIQPEREHFHFSLVNMARYLVLRRYDLRDCQDALRMWGLSSLGRVEAQVIPNLDAVIATLATITGTNIANIPLRPSASDFDCGRDHLNAETIALFGDTPHNRRVRMMVTLPTQAAYDADFVRDLLIGGMNVARINCAHDTPEEWSLMIDNLRRAEATTGYTCKVAMDLAGPKSRTADIHLPHEKYRIRKGDTILLTKDVPVLCRDDIVCVRCTLPTALDQVQTGHSVWFDDGKIGAVVAGKLSEGVVLRVTDARGKGEKLKEDKGINFPDTKLALNPLTTKDLLDLDFVVANADIINYSFVQTADDVTDLQDEIAARNPTRTIGLVLKIETARAIRNLPQMIARAGQRNPVGVMIARGDLAVEIGFQRLAEMQEEIMWIAESAHVPVIWATQVLESLAKKGRPSRAEVTDAAMSERAECVMLNKGAYILDAQRILNDILVRMSAHQSKKSARLRALHSW